MTSPERPVCVPGSAQRALLHSLVVCRLCAGTERRRGAGGAERASSQCQRAARQRRRVAHVRSFLCMRRAPRLIRWQRGSSGRARRATACQSGGRRWRQGHAHCRRAAARRRTLGQSAQRAAKRTRRSGRCFWLDPRAGADCGRACAHAPRRSLNATSRAGGTLKCRSLATAAVRRGAAGGAHGRLQARCCTCSNASAASSGDTRRSSKRRRRWRWTTRSAGACAPLLWRLVGARARAQCRVIR